MNPQQITINSAKSLVKPLESPENPSDFSLHMPRLWRRTADARSRTPPWRSSALWPTCLGERGRKDMENLRFP
jgi:hypothetical protein